MARYQEAEVGGGCTGGPGGRGGGLLRRLALGLVRSYQVAVSPFLPPSCRFYPSCSQYALESIEVHGVVRGGFLALRRLLRCHPFHPGGFDPVPPRTASGNKV